MRDATHQADGQLEPELLPYDARDYLAGYLVGAIQALGGMYAVEAHDDGARPVPSFTVTTATGARIVVTLDRFDL